MKKYRFLIVILLAIFCFGGLQVYSQGTLPDIHVSPDGSDSASGHLDSPVYSLERAQELFKSGEFSNTIYIHAGIYRRSSSFVINSSGMTLKTYGDGEVRFLGSVKLPKSEFTVTNNENILNKLPISAQGKVYQIDLSGYTGKTQKHAEYASQSSQTSYYDLYVSKKQQTLARWPNNDWALTGTVINNSTFRFYGEGRGDWSESGSAMLFGYWKHNWSFQPVYISATDERNGIISLSKEPQYGIDPKMRYFAFNLIEEMDIPGEWYIDNETDILYYYPTENFTDDDIEITTMTTELIKIEASDITIDGINVEMTRGNGITASGSRNNIKIINCRVKNIGNTGIVLSSVKNSVIKNSNIYNIGGSGIILGGGERLSLTPGNSSVENCHIYNFGRTFRTYQGGVNISGVGNSIINNKIHDAPHLAIKLDGNDNYIGNNEIYNVLTETSDSGAIYTGRNWTTLGNVIYRNYFHDIIKDETLSTYSVQAVYIDDMAGGVTVVENIFKSCTQAALFGGGRNNIFSNNIIIDCDTSLDYDARAIEGEWAYSSTLPGGTVYTGLMNLLDNSGYSSALWEGKYPGFSQLVTDAKNLIGGIPKGAQITNNSNYGGSVFLSSYEAIHPSVIDNGAVDGNTKSESEYGDIPVSDIGTEAKWRPEIELTSPENNRQLSDNIILNWHKTEGSEGYNVKLSKNGDMSEPLLNVTTKKLKYNIEFLKKGVYYWQITALGAGGKEIKSKIYSFTLLENTTASSRVISSEDFEAYTGEINFNTVGTHNLGNWSFNIAAGDSVTVMTDPVTNSKALKLVKGTSTSALDVKFNFPSVTSGKVKISYDVRFQNHSRYLEYWGDVRGTTNTFKTILLYRNNYYRSNTSGSNFLFGIGDYTQSYTTVEQYCDFDNGSHSIESINKLTAAKTGAKTENSNCTEVANVLFKLKNQNDGDMYNSYKGQATDGTAENNGIYWIDNIKVEYMVDLTVKPLLNDNFLGYTEGLTFDTVGRHTLGNWEFVIAKDGDSVTVMTDPVTNSRSLKMVKGSADGDLNVYYNFGNMTGGKLRVEYDTRFEHHSKNLTAFGQLQDSANNSVMNLFFVKSEYWKNAYSDYLTNLITNINNHPDRFMNVTQTIDFDKKTFLVEAINKDGSTKSQKSAAISRNETNKMVFKIVQDAGTYKGADAATVENPNNNGIYWIDNIRVEKITLGVNATLEKTGNKIKLSANIENYESASLFIVKISDNQGRIIELDIENLNAGKSLYEKEFVMDEVNYNINYYLWESFGSLRPLTEAE